ncbi:MAG: competence/damage-inducible protein A [Polyangiaceae bacterium]|nr:competence/damage-inducible protein A [Polyangiaceae bacterium]
MSDPRGIDPDSTPAVRVVHTAAAVVVGNEILSGKVRDTNVVELARTLRGLGIRFSRVVVVADDCAEIAAEIAALRASHDVVFTSGGVGPTHDDLTIAAAAAAFGVEIVISEAMADILRAHYGARCRDEHLRMARVPAGAWLARVPDSQWPAIVMRDVWLLPGVPEVFRAKLEVIRAWLRGPAPFFTRAVYLATEESEVVSVIDTVAAAHPQVEVGSYPRWEPSDHRTKITFDARESLLVEAACADLLARLPAGEPVRVE